MKPQTRSCILATWCLLTGIWANAAEQVPLEFDGNASLSYSADPIFELGPEGTIDFWVRAGWTSPLEQDACVVANGDKATSRYAAYLTGDGQGVVLWDGTRSAGAPFNFLDGEAHFVSIVTRAGESKFFVDGTLIDTRPIGYGNARGLPLHVGTSDGGAEGFVGQIQSLRLWSRALSDADVVQTGSYLGEPPPGSPLSAALRVVSDFNASAQQLVLLDPPAAGVMVADASGQTGYAPPAAPSPPPAPVDPGIQMWSVRTAADRWRQPPTSSDAFVEMRQGAIDFWVQYDPSWETQDLHGTLVAYSNSYDTVFEVGMSAAGDGIVMSNGKRDDYGQVMDQTNIVPFDFNDGMIHHVAVVTEGDSTDVFIDGRKRGVASVGYALAEDASGPKTNLQLSIGSLDGRQRAFQGSIGAVRVWGAPLPGEALFRAAFLRDNELTAVPWADSFLVAQLENVAGRTSKPALRFLPPLYLPAGIWMVPTDAERRQTKPGATLKDIDWTFHPQRYMQLVVAAPDSDLAKFAGAGGGAPSAARPGAQPTSAMVVPSGFHMTDNAGVGGRPAQSLVGVSLDDCAQQCRNTSAFHCTSFDYVPAAKRCELNSTTEPLRRGMSGSYSFAAETKQVTASAAAPASAPAGSPLAALRPAEPAASASVPVLVWLEYKPFESLAKPESVSARTYRPAGRNRYTSTDGQQLSLSSRIYLNSGAETLQRFDIPDRPPRVGQARIDDVFIVGNQVRNRRAALQGWDPIKLNPFDFSKPEGGKKADLFSYSPFGYSENARMVIPKGFTLIDLQSGEGRREHTEITTEAKLQQEVGAMISVGGGVEGMMAAGSFSANASFNAKSEKLNSGTSAFTLGQSVNQRVALLLDKANVRISAPFRQAVLDAARGTPTPDSARRLVEQFGTHYAHGIVLGGRIVEIIEMDSETWGIVNSIGIGVGAAVEGRVGPADGPNASASLAASMDASQEQSFKSSIQKSKENWYYSGGQAGGSAGSWLVTDETMAPIYLDLRPISELLAPPFFLEPAVFNVLRPLVREAMRDYVARTAGPIEVNQTFVPKNVAKYVPPVPKKDCAYDEKSFRVAKNTDSDNNNDGGVWVKFALPAAKHFEAKQFKDGCYARNFWEDKWLAECNRVCWSNAVFICKDGTWEKQAGYSASTDLLCHDSGETQQDGLLKGFGPAPWAAEEAQNAQKLICDSMRANNVPANAVPAFCK